VPHRPVRTDENQVVGDQRIAVEAVLIAVLFDVIGPALLPGLLIEGVEGASAGADEYQIPGDRRSRIDSATGFKLPQHLWVRRLGEAGRRNHQQGKYQYR
jgi:hypothetical protein